MRYPANLMEARQLRPHASKESLLPIFSSFGQILLIRAPTLSSANFLE